MSSSTLGRTWNPVELPFGGTPDVYAVHDTYLSPTRTPDCAHLRGNRTHSVRVRESLLCGTSHPSLP